MQTKTFKINITKKFRENLEIFNLIFRDIIHFLKKTYWRSHSC